MNINIMRKPTGGSVITAELSAEALQYMDLKLALAVIDKMADRIVEEEYASIVKRVKKQDLITGISAQVAKKVVERMYR